MSHTNSTTNYGLPQFLTTDKPFWLTDINGAFSDIDTAIKAAKDAGDDAQNDATQALSDASSASSAAAAADAKGAGAVASLADAFDSTSTYIVGDIVIYNSLLYRCYSAVTTPGPWTGGTNWARTTVENIIGDKADASTVPTIDRRQWSTSLTTEYTSNKPIFRVVISSYDDFIDMTIYFVGNNNLCALVNNNGTVTKINPKNSPISLNSDAILIYRDNYPGDTTTYRLVINCTSEHSISVIY